MNSLLQLSSYALSEEALKMFASPFDPFLFYSSSNHLHLYHLYKNYDEEKNISQSTLSPSMNRKIKCLIFLSIRIRWSTLLETIFS